MNEFLRNFIMKTIFKMINNNVAEWQVREYALGWYTKGVLTEEDLKAIDEKYKEQPVEEVVENIEETEEEVVDESNDNSSDN